MLDQMNLLYVAFTRPEQRLLALVPSQRDQHACRPARTIRMECPRPLAGAGGSAPVRPRPPASGCRRRPPRGG
jgi:hypothetical protein